jgi:hypothetical protein
MIGKVTKCEEATGKESGRVYLKVTVLSDGVSVTFNAFNTEKMKAMDFFARAFKEGLWVDVTTEESGKFTNLKSFKVASSEIPSDKPVVAKEAIKPEKPTTTDKPQSEKMLELIYKNRSISISYAKDEFIAGKIEKSEIITEANKFLLFIESGKI